MQQKIRKENHHPSAKSKSNSHEQAVEADVQVGSLVYMKNEASKSNARDCYIIINIKDKVVTLQKFSNSGKFMSKTYDVRLEDIYPAVQ